MGKYVLCGIVWVPIASEKPGRDDLGYYGDRFSVPVLLASAETGDTHQAVMRLDHKNKVWVDVDLLHAPMSEEQVDGWTHFAYLRPIGRDLKNKVDGEHNNE